MMVTRLALVRPTFLVGFARRPACPVHFSPVRSSHTIAGEKLSPSSLLPSRIQICGKEYETDKWTTVTPKVLDNLIGRELYRDKNHPIGLISEGIRQHFKDFQLFEFPSPVVTTYQNFDSLLVPAGHISRNKSESYYINERHLLRAHTSAHQEDCLRSGADKILCIADVYRRDEVDKKHFLAFHQCELIHLFKAEDLGMTPAEAFVQPSSSGTQHPRRRTPSTQESYTSAATDAVVAHMKNSIEGYVTAHVIPALKANTTTNEEVIDGDDSDQMKMRWVEAYFPFTHPSFELEIYHNGEWLEMLGAGMVENGILENAQRYDSNTIDSPVSRLGWACGFGLERLAMLRYAIPDIRLFWTSDTGFTHQFKNKTPQDLFHYKPISTFISTKMDLSFWLPDDTVDWSDNDFYDIVQSHGMGLIEQVELLDTFTSAKHGKRARCYRITYRSHERALTKPECLRIHQKIEEFARLHLGVAPR